MQTVIPIDGMVITRDTVFAPGVYVLPHGVEIAADGITLDGNGAVIVGENFAGRGVSIHKRKNVTVKNLDVERFYHGIYAEHCRALRLERNRARNTHELAGPNIFLDVWLGRQHAYGGGFFLAGCADGVLDGNDCQHQQNGILLYGCQNMRATRNNASFNSGYGFLLFESSQNVVEENTADFCCRIYHYDQTGEPYHNGADAAGLVMMCNSSRNQILRNKLRGGGDGVFLGGFHRDKIKTPCNDNLFEGNDGSYSPNIAFEATFSQRNIFRGNRADFCNYGFWLGYSSHTQVDGNSIRQNRAAGVAIEHGHHNIIEGNAFERNADGAQFWVTANPPFTDFFPECSVSADNIIRRNTFSHNDCGVRIWTETGAANPHSCARFTIEENSFADNRAAFFQQGLAESWVQIEIT